MEIGIVRPLGCGVSAALTRKSVAGSEPDSPPFGCGVIFGVVGVLAIFSTETPEKDEVTRACADRIATAKLVTMFTAGILVQIINVDALAVASPPVTAVVYVAVPGSAGPLLKRMTERMLANSRMLEIVVGLAFGVMFFWKGLAVLL